MILCAALRPGSMLIASLLFLAQAFTPLGTLEPGGESWAVSVSGDGRIVHCLASWEGKIVPARWERGKGLERSQPAYMPLPPGGLEPRYTITGCALAVLPQRGEPEATWVGAGLTPGPNSVPQAFLYDAGAFNVVWLDWLTNATTNRSAAFGITANAKLMVGYCEVWDAFSSNVHRSQAVFWKRAGKYAALCYELPTPASYWHSYAYAASDDGWRLVGWQATDSIAYEALMWERPSWGNAHYGVFKIKKLLENEGVAEVQGWLLGTATGISLDGRYACGSGRPGYYQGGTLWQAYLADLGAEL